MKNDEHFSEGKFQGKVLESLRNIEEKLETKVDQTEFRPVKSIVYGLVGLIMLAVVGAIVATVVRAVELLS